MQHCFCYYLIFFIKLVSTLSDSFINSNFHSSRLSLFSCLYLYICILNHKLFLLLSFISIEWTELYNVELYIKSFWFWIRTCFQRRKSTVVDIIKIVVCSLIKWIEKTRFSAKSEDFLDMIKILTFSVIWCLILALLSIAMCTKFELI